MTKAASCDTTTLPPDGGERFNRLIFARSPYLLQHAENPVDWYEWGDAAFEKARTENRPILLSIGYATCHWCHVMAHESFGDLEVAELLNRHFVCIKVDREERPDIDDFYMTVSRLLTGSGGWPLNIFMTPDKRPFFAMTYLPKRGRQGMSGFMELLGNIAVLWRQQPDRIDKNCSLIMDSLTNLSRGGQQEYVDPTETAVLAFKQLEGIYDSEHGGFGQAPKFPMPGTISWLLEQGHAGHEEALKMALHTLRKIRQGGIWDQLGGGLHRYSVDREWLAPHFEKMLYDQATMALVALEAFQVCGDVGFREMAENIFTFTGRELTSPENAFYSALDADSEGVEGKFYLWDKDEIESVLGADSELFCSCYDVTVGGNFEGGTILNLPVGLDALCDRERLDREKTEAILERCRAALFERRTHRIRPFLDQKIITAWNGLMIAALAKGGVICGEPEYIDRALRAASFILDNLRRADGRLLRSYLGGPSDIPAFLEDYAFLCLGLIELYEATLDEAWLERALALADDMTRLFYDPSLVSFTTVGHDAEQMPVRVSLEHDGVIPSAFSVAAKCFIRLGHTADRPDLHDLAHAMLGVSLADAQKQPVAHLAALQAADMLDSEPFIVRLSGKRDSPLIREFVRVVKAALIPVLVIRFNESDGEGEALLCGHGSCYPPVYDVRSLERILTG